ncbi:MAG: acetyl-CoA carboxylase biotin carboxylase subunit [Anaerolineales bacterium]|nr:acetyl-CoA carboxylase biotin carboxylase subunit [Anaerolineales bacterium]MDW8279492.1 acetyl-CoA carboxylase biotin carboxylase subunit [Anaerolineales bacterium]
MFRKILVANRAEIAIRIMRACRELGIATVAVHSSADRDAPHVRFAEEAVDIGQAAPRESYLNISNVIQAAKQTGAEAIHPGYGFLSENAEFAEAVAAAGLTFIGPPASAIRAMGDKAESKRTMRAAGVPTVPGAENLSGETEFIEAAERIGYPVLVKAAAGGGGKGMRVVRSAREMPEALESARRESQNAFGDDRLLLEKYIENAHHIEIQVFGDRHGHLVHLFERECSVQRRHQKIIEESPSPLLTPEIRERMGAAAVAAARAVGYFNAGTVEFIFDPRTADFYFLEMNTRLQVEHPVTEAVTGLDLAQWQIRVAAGEPFPYRQADLTQRGHAIECRLYAEDPAGGFLPSTGRILQFLEPRGPGIRVDSGIVTGSEVTRFYDPLLAKIIVYAEDRPAAIRRMRAALKETVLHGVTSNLDFLQAILARPEFAEGKIHTRWVETEFDWQPPEPPLEALLAAVLAGSALENRNPKIEHSVEPDPFSPWKSGSGFRIG